MFSDLKSSAFSIVNSTSNFSLDLGDEFFNNTVANQTDLIIHDANGDKVIGDNIIAISIIVAGIFIVVAVGICMFWLNRNESVLRERYMRCAQNPDTLKMDQPSTSGVTFCNAVSDEVELQQMDDVELRQRKVEETHFPKTLMSSPSNNSNNRECTMYYPSNFS
ncbi:hypothetical protein [Ehrlichia canis]|uniref:Uncharacterized protein n=1 Tax=Ehrlichia canis (strain Jake) TaxID=269484 RepID=A0ACA6AW92_EHRCJ|nr:hypothetical protein [Ehrlichia canis]AAZ68803.1 hypothetical protein Ecaj_0772 [Ehrlichia canis str. Jake]AUO54468.1 hypothetical protein C1I72_00935 [Ehrlichia canis]UKC53675.1 hypothetical protein s20019040002_000718 [Ehrlichia canis]UKC54613.1 hypothetical protein s20026770001_000719 [Ehrlichia canis]UKC55549.1 hypothetical protein s21009500007_000719 [Ehrlichia canis]